VFAGDKAKRERDRQTDKQTYITESVEHFLIKLADFAKVMI